MGKYDLHTILLGFKEAIKGIDEIDIEDILTGLTVDYLYSNYSTRERAERHLGCLVSEIVAVLANKYEGEKKEGNNG